MKDYYIYLFDNVENLEKTVGFVNIKEQFINNSFVDEALVLLSLSEDFSERVEIPLSVVKKNLVKNQEFTVPQYGKKYSKQIQMINEFLDRNNYCLSWLDIFQLAILLECKGSITDSSIIDSINQLMNFKKILENKY